MIYISGKVAFSNDHQNDKHEAEIENTENERGKKETAVSRSRLLV